MEKLVRDNVPSIIRSSGKVVHARKLEHGEQYNWLRLKLLEEADELLQASSRDEILGELVDVKEVYDTLLRELHILPQEVERKQAQKREQKGGFGEFWVLTTED
jgi:predicted house-cleaning noncanonical NTP pyrophosphatase (MazG superfamily)